MLNGALKLLLAYAYVKGYFVLAEGLDMFRLGIFLLEGG
jgi:hypothetical protein